MTFDLQSVLYVLLWILVFDSGVRVNRLRKELKREAEASQARDRAIDASICRLSDSVNRLWKNAESDLEQLKSMNDSFGECLKLIDTVKEMACNTR